MQRRRPQSPHRVLRPLPLSFTLYFPILFIAPIPPSLLSPQVEAAYEQLDAACRRVAALEADKEAADKAHAGELAHLTAIAAHTHEQLQQQEAHHRGAVEGYAEKIAGLEVLVESLKGAASGDGRNGHGRESKEGNKEGKELAEARKSISQLQQQLAEATARQRQQGAAAAELEALRDQLAVQAETAEATERARVGEIEALRTALQLPPQWAAMRDHTSGRVYFFNQESGESRWDVPAARSGKAQPQSENQQLLAVQPALPEGWVAMVDTGSNRTYYYNRLTGESRWNMHSLAGSSHSGAAQASSAATAGGASYAGGSAGYGGAGGSGGGGGSDTRSVASGGSLAKTATSLGSRLEVDV